MPINTFLFRLIISDFKCQYATAIAGISGSVNMSICGRPDIYTQFDNTLKTIVKKIETFEKFFGVEYSLTKYG